MNSFGDFDFVVVGAGTAGSVLAARLSEDGRHHVALIEAGGSDRNFWIHAPLGYGKLYDDPNNNWLYESQPEPGLAGGKSFLPRGKVLGGTGSINGMIYVRGHPDDYNHWRQLGNVGWSYADVLPYFRKTEDNTRGADKYHGVGGPIAVTDARRNPLADAFVEAGVEAGYERNTDFNGASQDGFGYNQVTIRGGRRSSSSIEMLRPAMRRGNLAVFTRTLARRIIFDGRRAVGVEVTRDGAVGRINARREIVLAGGSFNSPQLLQVSGVGPAELLRKFDIPVLADRSEVGANLQDHFGLAATFRCTQPVTVNDHVNSVVRRMAMGAQYVFFRSGVMASNATMVAGCIRTKPGLESPDVKLQVRLWGRSVTGRSKEKMGLLPFSSFIIAIMLLRPNNRGSVRITGPRTDQAPEIRFNYLTSDIDCSAIVAGVHTMRRVMSQPAIAPFVAEEILPGKDVVSDEDVLAFCRRKGTSNHHPVGTCRMGVDEQAVVDPRLLLTGFDGLRIADGSIMPSIIGGNTNAPIVMIAEKASDMILQDARRA